MSLIYGGISSGHYEEGKNIINGAEINKSMPEGREILDPLIKAGDIADIDWTKVSDGKSARRDEQVQFKDLPTANSLPANLKLPKPLKSRNKIMAKLEKLAFTAGALAWWGTCALAAMIPNRINRKRVNNFTPEQIADIKNKLQPGDIILTKNKHRQTFYYMLHGLFGHKYSHAATYAGKGEIVDSYDKPDRQKLDDVLGRITDCAIIRANYDDTEQPYRNIQYQDNQIGKPYDNYFNIMDTSAHYCSELTLRGLEASGLETKVQGHAIMNQPFILPDDFLHVDGFDVIGHFSSVDKKS